MKTSIVFVPSYCLRASLHIEQLQLTSMAREAMRVGVETLKREAAVGIMISTAYKSWRREYDLQKKFSIENGVDEFRIFPIGPITDSISEALEAITKAIRIGANKIIVVAEEWHARRCEIIFREFAPADIEIEMVTFKSPRFEFTYEPLFLKSWRTGFKTTWILWNKIFLELTPTMIKAAQRKAAAKKA